MKLGHITRTAPFTVSFTFTADLPRRILLALAYVMAADLPEVETGGTFDALDAGETIVEVVDGAVRVSVTVAIPEHLAEAMHALDMTQITIEAKAADYAERAGL